MNIEQAKKILEKFTTEHKLFNIKHSDGLEEAIETLLTAYEKEKKDNEQWEKYATNDLENQITERNNKIFELEEELKKEKEKNKEYKDMIIRHKNQLKQSGIYGYDFDLEILEEE